MTPRGQSKSNDTDAAVRQAGSGSNTTGTTRPTGAIDLEGILRGAQDASGDSVVQALFGINQAFGTATFINWYYGARDDGSSGSIVGPLRMGATPTLNDAINGLLQSDPQAVKGVQAALWRAGYYDKLLKKGQVPRWGFVDEVTRRAYSGLLTDAVIAAKRNENVFDMLANRERILAEGGDPDAGEGGGAGRVGGGNTYVVQLSDPRSVRQMGDRVGQAVLKRGLTAAEHKRLYASVTGAQRGAQSAGDSAQEAQAQAMFAAATGASAKGGAERPSSIAPPVGQPGSAAGTAGADTYIPAAHVTTYAPDPEAIAEDFLRREQPIEAGAADVTDTYGAFLKIITGG